MDNENDLLIQFGKKFQSEIDEHQIEQRLTRSKQQNKQKKIKEYQDYIDSNNNLQQLIQKNPTSFNISDCENISNAISIWENEYHKYKIFLQIQIPFGGLKKIKENEELLQNLHKLETKKCKK